MNGASRPEVHYARSGDVSIAYQIVGEGTPDLVFVPFLANIVWQWEQPLYVRLYRRLSSFARLILLDKRGTGFPIVRGICRPWRPGWMTFARSWMPPAPSERL